MRLPYPEGLVVLVRPNMAKALSGLRASTRPRDLLDRVQLLLLAFALANLVGALVVAAASGPDPLALHIAGLAAPMILAAVWASVYKRRSFCLLADAAVMPAICLFTMAIDDRWSYYVVAVLTAAVFFGAAYGSTPRVLLRTPLISAVLIGQGLTDATSATVAAGFVIGFLLVSVLMHGMASSISKCEKTARQQHVLAATGLDLVAAGDMSSIAAATLDGGHALSERRPYIRVTLAIAEGIEKIEQADRLRTLECDIGQGYLFSRPLPSDAISTFLRERTANGTGSQQARAA
jgi:hypothetical protein